MCISNEDRSPMRVHSGNTAPGPTGLAELVSDYFPILHHRDALTGYSKPFAVLFCSLQAVRSPFGFARPAA
jgi:hypothetical protein